MIRAAYEGARDSLFLLPAAIIIVLGVAAEAAVLVDQNLRTSELPWLLPTTVDSARSILSTVATATVTVAAIVFAMTAVIVQLATSQFSPRVTQGFLRDRYQQVTVGVTVGTFVFALLVLSSVRGTEEGPQTVRDFSVTAAVVLAVVSMLAIVSFIDRIMRSMRVDSIIRRLADHTLAAIHRLPDREPPAEDVATPTESAPVTEVAAARSGWVRDIDVSAILDALPGETTVRLELKIGDFIAEGETAATVWGVIDAKVGEAIGDALDVGLTRTIDADPGYGIRQMIDIALRALSPAVNDATTAADVVHHMSGPLRAILLRRLPARVAGDQRGNGVYIPRALTHSDYMHGAFQEIRINSARQPHVLRALLETLGSLLSIVEDAERADGAGALREEVKATVAVIKASDMTDADKRSLLDFVGRSLSNEASGLD